MTLVLLVGVALVVHAESSAAAPPRTSREAGGLAKSDGGAAWASFKQIDVVEQRAQQAVGVVQAGAAGSGGAAGGSGVAVGQASGPGRPDGCYQRPIGSSDGSLRLLQVCPGLGGYLGLAGEAFGISELVLRDPATGEVLPTAQGSQAQLVVADPQVLAERAAAALDLPAPVMHMSPEEDQVVQLASWLWIPAEQWRPRQVSASAGPVTSTVTATPTRVTWDMGNGDQIACAGPGRPYEPRFAGRPDASDCTYTYRRSSAGQPNEAYDVTATIDWDVTWTATGAAGGGSLGSVPMSASQPVRVTEIQALVQ